MVDPLGEAPALPGCFSLDCRTAAMELFGRTFPPGPLPIKTLRNTDFQVRVMCLQSRLSGQGNIRSTDLQVRVACLEDRLSGQGTVRNTGLHVGATCATQACMRGQRAWAVYHCSSMSSAGTVPGDARGLNSTESTCCGVCPAVVMDVPYCGDGCALLWG